MNVDDTRSDQPVPAPEPTLRTRCAARVVRAAGALLAAAALTACASVVPGRATAADTAVVGIPTTDAVEAPVDPPAADAAEATAWMNRVCGALVKLTDSTGEEPSFDYSSPRTVTAGVVRFLDRLEDAVDTTRSELEAAGPAPIATGEAFVAELTDTLSIVRGSLEQTKRNLGKAIPRSSAALEKALEPLTSIDDQLAPLEQPEGGAEIDAAAADAPNCQELEHLTGTEDGFALQGISWTVAHA